MLSDWLTKKSVENKCGGNTSVLEKIWQMKFNYYLLCEGNFRRKHLFILVLFIHPSNFFVLRPYADVRLFTCILSSEFCTIFLTIDNNKVFNYLGRTFWLLGNSLLVNHKVCVLEQPLGESQGLCVLELSKLRPSLTVLTVYSRDKWTVLHEFDVSGGKALCTSVYR